MILEHMHLTLIFPLSSLKSQNIIILRYKYKKKQWKKDHHIYKLEVKKHVNLSYLA